LERGNDRKIDGRRVVVDYERGRTKQEWVPRRLGGGKGEKRRDRDTERLIRDLKKNEPLLIDRSRSRSNDKKVEVKSEPAKLVIKAESIKEEVKVPMIPVAEAVIEVPNY
jgi:U1 small nuclear ribonucleoprotein